jgi:ABC-2 type transport system permease protein
LKAFYRLLAMEITNISIGYTFSTIAENQLQAMQMSMMFLLPNILLSGFLFPFAGMPDACEHW